jgi:hypothetical protein
LHLAPGEEILTEVFSKLGSEYHKPKDTARIAREMRPQEIDDDIKDVLKKVYEMSPDVENKNGKEHVEEGAASSLCPHLKICIKQPGRSNWNIT